MSRHGREATVEFCTALSVRMKNERFNEADHLELTAGCKGRITRRDVRMLHLKTILVPILRSLLYKHKACWVILSSVARWLGDNVTRFTRYSMYTLREIVERDRLAVTNNHTPDRRRLEKWLQFNINPHACANHLYKICWNVNATRYNSQTCLYVSRVYTANVKIFRQCAFSISAGSLSSFC